MIARQIIFFILSVILGVLIIGGIYAIDSYYTSQTIDGNNKETCESLSGIYLETYNECEGIAKEACESIKGTFNECASACRHNPEAEFCILSCVQVCELP